jgi:hypothetical protein
MSFDLQRMLESKRAFRLKLASRPVAEKLRLLDELRARALVIRASTTAYEPGMVAEPPGKYETDPK